MGIRNWSLSEMFRNYASNRVCQADIASNYDHKHQAVSLNDNSTGLSRMSIDITKVLIRETCISG